METVHNRFQRPHRINLSDDYACTHASSSSGESSTTPSVAAHYEVFSSKQNVGGSHNPIYGALSSAVTVVEQMFGVSIIYGYDRIFKGTIFFHGSQPHNARRGFFGASFHTV